MTESLNEQFAVLHAERVRTMDPVKLQRNIDQRAALVAAFDPETVVQVGDAVGPFELLDVEGGTITLDSLVANGPAVLVFFRYAGCPACNLALPYYQRTLWPALAARGVPLVAISPQLPERLREIRTRHGLGFTVASDPGYALGRRFGITFVPDAATLPEIVPGEPWLGELTGTGSWELPQPTVVIIGRDRTVRFVDVSPDWLVRTESHLVLEALGEVRLAAAA
jgi:peroxiredoxin